METNNANRSAGVFIVNNTGSDLRMFDGAILEAILAGGALPDELVDVLTLTPVVVDGATRWIINFA